MTVAACLLALTLVPTALAKKGPSGSWASAQIATVVGAGLLAPSAEEFRPDDPLTAGELAEALSALGTATPAPADPSAPVELGELDAALVRHLGLTQQAKQFRSALSAAGLEPTKRAGTAIVSKMLKLHPNHRPESRELAPSSPVNRAEAAYAIARVLALPGSWEVADVKAKASAFALPELGDWQRRILSTAVRFLGYPYVWAGSSEDEQVLGGGPAPGGFDCSGFVWRVFKLESYPEAPQLADVLRGRTTYVMSAEAGRASRIARDQLAPADLVFFGDNGPKSKPAAIGHMGIYLGNGWFIHSSSGAAGVTISALEGWYADRFAWGRRPLAEAGLA